MMVYPRPRDKKTVWATRTSLNFDMMRSQVFDDRKGEGLNIWIASGLTGLIVAIFTFLISTMEDEIVALRMNTT